MRYGLPGNLSSPGTCAITGIFMGNFISTVHAMNPGADESKLVAVFIDEAAIAATVPYGNGY
jgi:hypothetical protein